MFVCLFVLFVYVALFYLFAIFVLSVYYIVCLFTQSVLVIDKVEHFLFDSGILRIKQRKYGGHRHAQEENPEEQAVKDVR